MNITQQEIGWARVWTCISLMWVIALKHQVIQVLAIDLFLRVLREMNNSHGQSACPCLRKRTKKALEMELKWWAQVSHSRQLVDPIWTHHLQPHPLVLINKGTWVSFLQGTKRGKHLLCTAYWNLLWHNIPWAPITSFISKYAKGYSVTPRDSLKVDTPFSSPFHLLKNVLKSLRFRYWADADEVGCIDQRAKVQRRPQVHPTLEEWSPDSFPA